MQKNNVTIKIPPSALAPQRGQQRGSVPQTPITSTKRVKDKAWLNRRNYLLNQMIHGPLPLYVHNPTQREIRELKLTKCKTPTSNKVRKLKSKLKRQAPKVADSYFIGIEEKKSEEADDDDDDDENMKESKSKRRYTQFDRMDAWLNAFVDELEAKDKDKFGGLRAKWEKVSNKIYHEFQNKTNRIRNNQVIMVGDFLVCHASNHNFFIVYFCCNSLNAYIHTEIRISRCCHGMCYCIRCCISF